MSGAVSASKAKRLAARAAKSAKNGTPATSGKNTPVESGNNSSDELPLSNLKISTDRTATGVYSSQERSRDIKIDSFSLNFHGRVLIDNASIELNFGRRYGLIGSNGSGKSTFLQSLAARDIEIPDHIDVSKKKKEKEKEQSKERKKKDRWKDLEIFFSLQSFFYYYYKSGTNIKIIRSTS